MTPSRLRCLSVCITTLLVVGVAPALHAQPAPAPTPSEPAAAPAPDAPAGDSAPANTGARAFKSEGKAGERTPLDRCIEDVQRLERDEIGVPFLAAAYVAFFVILGVFFVLVRVKQRRMEEEMGELRRRLARLQGDGS